MKKTCDYGDRPYFSMKDGSTVGLDNDGNICTTGKNTNDYPINDRDNDKDYGGNSGGQSYGGSKNDKGSKEILAKRTAVTKGFTGQSLCGGFGDNRYDREYEEIPYVNKGMLQAARKLDYDNNPKAVNFILFNDCKLNDDDMYWLTSMFNTHKSSLAVNTIDLSNNFIRLEKDNGLPFFSFNHPYNTPRNILRLDLSNNQIGDAGAKVVADGLANGVLPITKYVNLSGNKITDTGKGFIANMMHKLNQGLVVTLETIQNASKESFKLAVKGMLSVAKSNGVSTKEALTTEETIEHCKKGSWNVGFNIFTGYAKCFTGADTPIALYQKDMHSLLVKTTVNVINPLKKPMQFVCMTQETFFSVVDEDFANCLTGVDSGLND